MQEVRPVSYTHLQSMLETLLEIQENCSDIKWATEEDNGTLLNALDDNEDDEFEFKMSFAMLEAECENLYYLLTDHCIAEYFDTCTVALIGNRFNTCLLYTSAAYGFLRFPETLYTEPCEFALRRDFLFSTVCFFPHQLQKEESSGISFLHFIQSMFNAPLHVNIAQKSTVETHFQILLRQYTRISRQRYCNPEIHEYLSLIHI